MDGPLQGGVLETLPDLAQFLEAVRALLFQIRHKGARGTRSFMSQMFHGHVHIMDAAQDTLDPVQLLGEPGGVDPERGREKLRLITRLAQRDAELVQFFRRGRVVQPGSFPNAVQRFVHLGHCELRQPPGQLRFDQPRQFHAEQPVDFEALTGEMWSAQTAAHGRVDEVPPLLVMA